MGEYKSCLYLINLGDLQLLKDKFILDKTKLDNKELCILKFGQTKNFKNRFIQHKTSFGKLGCSPEKLFKVKIPESKLTKAENKLKKMLLIQGYLFVQKDINDKGYNEIILADKSKINEIKNMYDEISKIFTEDEKIKVNNFEYEIENDKVCSSVFDFINWGHYIGRLDELFQESLKLSIKQIDKIFDKDNNLTHIKVLNSSYSNNTIFNPEYELYNVIKFKDETSLILDKVKKMFYNIKCNYVVGKIDGVKYLIYKNHNEVSLVDYLNRNDKENVDYLIKRIFVFNWIMCVKNGLCLSFENNIFIKSLNLFPTNTIECKDFIHTFSINEYNFTYNVDKTISPAILNKWFDGKLEKFYEIAKDSLDGINPETFRGIFKDVINFYNPDYIPWNNVVYERMIFLKNM